MQPAVHVPTYGAKLYGPVGQQQQQHQRQLQQQQQQQAHPSDPSKRTQSPMVTGTSVIAIRHKDGVVMAADTLGSYGSLARYRSVTRIKKIGEDTCVGGSGDISDLHEVFNVLDEIVNEDYLVGDGCNLNAFSLQQYLSRVMYNYRCKMDPLWNSVVVAGFKDGVPHLGLVDLRGTSLEDTTLATGYGAYLARPLLRKAEDKFRLPGKDTRDFKTTMTEEDAVRVVEDAMRVLYYRDARTINNIQLAKITKDGVSISEPYQLESTWTHGESIDRDGSF